MFPSTMRANASSILAELNVVAAERERRGALPELMARVQSIKRYQQRRFLRTYADLLQTQRYGGVARFFLDDILRKDPHERGNDPRELCITIGEIVRAVEVVEKEARNAAVSLRLQ